MATATYLGGYSTNTASTSHGGNVTISSNTKRKVVLMVGSEAPTSILSGVTFETNAATGSFGSLPDINPNDTNLREWWYFYDVPSGSPSGTFAIGVTSSNDSAIQWHAWEINNAATGAPESTNIAHSSGGAGTATVTSTANAAMVAGAILHAATQTIAWTGTVAEDNEVANSNFVTGAAHADTVGAGSRTATATPNTGGRVSVRAASFADDSAPSGPSPAVLAFFLR